MPGIDGIEATRRVADERPTRARVIVLTTFDLDEYVYDALERRRQRLPAQGRRRRTSCSTPSASSPPAKRCSRPTVTRRLIAEFAASAAAPARPTALAELTPRETEVLCLVAEACPTPRSPSGSCVSKETVKTHVSRVLGKLGLRDRSQAVIVAYESGLVVPRSS